MANEDNIQEMYKRAKKAFEEVEYWPQEKVDEMTAAAAWEWQKEETAKALARLAETIPYEITCRLGRRVRRTLGD